MFKLSENYEVDRKILKCDYIHLYKIIYTVQLKYLQ